MSLQKFSSSLSLESYSQAIQTHCLVLQLWDRVFHFEVGQRVLVIGGAGIVWVHVGAQPEYGYWDGRGGRALQSVSRDVSWVSRVGTPAYSNFSSAPTHTRSGTVLPCVCCRLRSWAGRRSSCKRLFWTAAWAGGVFWRPGNAAECCRYTAARSRPS